MSAEKTLENKAFFRSRELIAAVLAVLLIFTLALFSIDNSCYWGDDYAAYISQGIAMAEGRLDQQAELNIKMHPSPLPAEATEGGELIYVWGYPLILSFVYRLVGFDRLDYGSIFFYKLPSLIALALLAAVLFYFYRRRFGLKLSFLLALVFCSCTEMFDFLNTVYSDMVFLLLASLSLFLCELFMERKKVLPGLLFGLCLWFMYEVRLNGVSILLCCILAQTVDFAASGRKRSELIVNLLPYGVFFVLVLLSRLIIPPATPNTSDLGSGMSLASFLANLGGYVRLICHWLGLIWNSILINPIYSILRRIIPLSFESLKPLRDIMVGGSLCLWAIGTLFYGKGKNLHLAILTLVYIIIASTLPYTQGLRYVYPLLPLILMFIGCGLKKVSVLFEKLPRRLYQGICCFALCFCCFFTLYPHLGAALSGDKGVNELAQISSPSDIYMQNAYSPDAVELYRYIQDETGEDAVFAFFAPRALYLNTQRIGIRPGVNGHSIEDADYYIQYLSVGSYPVDRPPEQGFEACFENSQFILYEKVRK